MQLAPRDEQYVALLADLEDERRHFARVAHEFAKRHLVPAATLENMVLAQAATQGERALTRDAEVADFLSMVTAFSFALRAVSDYLDGDQRALITQDNLQRHLRYPTNLAVGALLQETQNLDLRVVREALLADLRRCLEVVPSAATEGLIRHHALHMMGRYGDQRDRAIVQYELREGLSRDDPVARKLGYCGLMMVPMTGPEFADQFLYYMAREPHLARADIAFDATHYGDMPLGPDGYLRQPEGALPRLAENIARHFLEPQRYCQIAEADAHRLIGILDLGGAAALTGRAAAMLQACIVTEMLPRETHEGRLLERRLATLLRDQAAPSVAVLNVTKRKAQEEDDVGQTVVKHAALEPGGGGSRRFVFVRVMPGGTVNTGDTFHNTESQIAAQGRQAHAESVEQLQSNQLLKVDLHRLVEELQLLQQHMRERATTAGEYRSVADVAEAIEAAEASDRKSVSERLRAAGTYALEVAKEIGSSVATEAIKKSMGL